MSSASGNYFAAFPARVPAEILESLRKDAPANLRWFHPEDLHITLAFFGNESLERLTALHDVLRQIPFAGLDVTLGPLVPLPKPHRATALAFELVQGRDELAELIATWRSPLLEAAGRDPDDRPPLPHLTIARPPREHTRAGKEQLLKWAQRLQLPPAPVQVLAPALYGWSHERHHRRFRIIKPD